MAHPGNKAAGLAVKAVAQQGPSLKDQVLPAAAHIAVEVQRIQRRVPVPEGTAGVYHAIVPVLPQPPDGQRRGGRYVAVLVHQRTVQVEKHDAHGFPFL